MLGLFQGYIYDTGGSLILPLYGEHRQTLIRIWLIYFLAFGNNRCGGLERLGVPINPCRHVAALWISRCGEVFQAGGRDKCWRITRARIIVASWGVNKPGYWWWCPLTELCRQPLLLSPLVLPPSLPTLLRTPLASTRSNVSSFFLLLLLDTTCFFCWDV